MQKALQGAVRAVELPEELDEGKSGGAREGLRLDEMGGVDSVRKGGWVLHGVRGLRRLRGRESETGPDGLPVREQIGERLPQPQPPEIASLATNSTSGGKFVLGSGGGEREDEATQLRIEPPHPRVEAAAPVPKSAKGVLSVEIVEEIVGFVDVEHIAALVGLARLGVGQLIGFEGRKKFSRRPARRSTMSSRRCRIPVFTRGMKSSPRPA